MAYWLVKSEPSTWSWDQQVAQGAKGEAWTGVRNHTAKLNMMKMKKGDRAFFYHSNEGKEIVGIVEIVREHYPDPTDKTEKFVCVDIAADKPLKKPVTLVENIARQNNVPRLAALACEQVVLAGRQRHAVRGGIERRRRTGKAVDVGDRHG